MSDSTEIQWTDATWNVVTGCTRVSPGCANCYIERTPPFRMAGRKFATIGGASTTGVQLHPARLDVPLRWRRPRRVFVCSLADLFHDDVPDEFIRTVFAVMASARDHTFQVLTKRPERAREFFASHHWRSGMLFWPAPSGRNDLLHTFLVPNGVDPGGIELEPDWSPPNIWLGVSIENARYTWRADVLRQIPAAIRFISAEPLLGSLYDCAPDITVADNQALHEHYGPDAVIARLRVAATDKRRPLDLTGIDWIIVGGESGPGARPFDLEHAREIIRAAGDACDCSHVAHFSGRRCGSCTGSAVFVKQLGAKPIRTRPGLGVTPVVLRDRKGGDWSEWPADLRIREFPMTSAVAA